MGYEVIWTGKILPNQFQSSYGAPPAPVSFIAVDGLALLNEKYLLTQDGDKFYGNVKVIELISYCLRQTGINLNIRVGINMYATGMNTTAADDPLDQAYINYDAFYSSGITPSLYNVIAECLKPFGAQIVQFNNKWNIFRVEECIDTFDYREYDSTGAYSSNSTFNPIINIEFPDDATHTVFTDRSQFLEINKGYGTIQIVETLGLRDNILVNGKFRFKILYIDGIGYVKTVNTDGFTIYQAQYPMAIGAEDIDGNAALLLSTDATVGTGENYILSNTYNVKTGANNTLKFRFRVKIPRPWNGVFWIILPYVKVRVYVKYGIYYLRGDGSWTTTESWVSFFCDKFNEYVDYEIEAVQPVAGASSGYDLFVRVYDAYPYHAEYASYAAVRAVVTDGIGVGYRTELDLADGKIRYYELEENTDAENVPFIIRPDDYDGSTNPHQWILQKTVTISYGTGDTYEMYIDEISLSYLDNGEEPLSEITQTIDAEPLNTDVLPVSISIGSYMESLSTIIQPVEQFRQIRTSGGTFVVSFGTILVTTSSLSADLLYSGFFVDSNGDGYEFWTRDGVSESEHMITLLLNQYKLQYQQSSRLIRANLRNIRTFAGFLTTFKEVNDSNRLYKPISMTIFDRSSRNTVEMIELHDFIADTSNGSALSPFGNMFGSMFG